MNMKRKLIAFVVAFVMVLNLAIMNTTEVQAANISLSSQEIANYFNSKVGSTVPQASCLAFIADGFKALGATRSTACCAYKYGSSHIVSTSMDNIPIGADIFLNWNSNYKGTWYKCTGTGGCGSYCHHIAVYVGDGYVVHTSGGKVIKTKLSELLSEYWNMDFRGWGYHGNVTIDGNAAEVSIFSKTYVENITQTNAVVRAELNAEYSVSECGVYISNNADMSGSKRISETTSAGVKHLWYDMNKWYGKLEANGTYYYQFYVVQNGKTIKSEIKSFTTLSGVNSAMFPTNYASNITNTNAQINATLSELMTVSEVGFYISRNADMSNSTKKSEKPSEAVLKIWYDMNKWYGTLSKGTTYYYQFYIVKNGVETKSNISSFTTTGDGQNPVIDSVYVTDVTGDGYTVVCSVKDNVGIARVSFPTWTEANGQDDLVGDWYNNEAVMTPNADNLYVYRVNIAKHNNEPGVYFTHVYAYDTAGNHASGGVTAAIYPLSSISLSASNESLQVGQQTYLSVYYNPDCTTENRSISWNSSDNNVATVSAEGTVIAVGTGQAVITATVAGKSAKCTVTVSAVATPVPTTAPAPTTEPSIEPTTAPTTEPAATPVPSEIKEQVEAFVSRMYTVVLDREAEEGGLNNWTNWLLSHEVDGAGIAEGFILSNEFKVQQLSDSDYLDVLYSTFFDREADEDGKNTWISLLKQGASREYVLAGFVNSVEFDSLCTAYGIDRGTMKVTGTSTGIRGFVERMYTTALERDADVSGMNTWTAQITTGTMTAEQVAKSFFFADEFVNRGLSNEDYVETLYATFMDRESDVDGKTMWVNLLNNGMSRTEVLEGFSRSTEFTNILASFGL